MQVVKRMQLKGSPGDLEPLKISIPGKQKNGDEDDCLAGLAFLYPGQRFPSSGYFLHSTEEFLYVKSGKIRIETNSNCEIAEEGDLILMRSREPHFNINISDEQAELLWRRSNS